MSDNEKDLDLIEGSLGYSITQLFYTNLALVFRDGKAMPARSDQDGLPLDLRSLKSVVVKTTTVVVTQSLESFELGIMLHPSTAPIAMLLRGEREVITPTGLMVYNFEREGSPDFILLFNHKGVCYRAEIGPFRF